MSMEITREIVTPRKATVWLNNKNNTNRKLRDGVVEQYADDMRNNKWTTCPVPISFYEDGDIADGQHRLFAIVESDTAQEFIIYRGLDRQAGLNLDTGLTRTLVDNAKISGSDRELSYELLATARAVEQGTRQHGGNSLSNSRRMEFVNKHREASQWAVQNGPRGRGLRNAIILGAVARAWYHESDKERLKRFGQVVSTGFMEGKHEAAAVAIRNYMLSPSASQATNSIALWRDSFLKTQNAISYFMKGKPLTVIKGVAEEAYPLKKRR